MRVGDTNDRLNEGFSFLAFLAIGLLLFSYAAKAQWYVEGQAGLIPFHESEGDILSQDFTADIDVGFAGLFSAGYRFGENFRASGEIGYRTGEFDAINNLALVGGSDANVLTGMVNLFYDFDAISPGLRPFVGAGLGLANLEAEQLFIVNNNIIDTDETGIAGQFHAGVSYALTNALSLTGSYNLLYVPTVEMEITNGINADADYIAHTVFVGLRYSFGQDGSRVSDRRERAGAVAAQAHSAQPARQLPSAPSTQVPASVTPVAQPAAAAAQPAPVPQPSFRSQIQQGQPLQFMVFFEEDSDRIEESAIGVLAQATDYANTGGYRQIVATGHADRWGSVTYNQSLSERRALSVQNALLGMNVASNRISTVAKGESAPLVQTADNVREPQNRRVEILLIP